MIDINLTAVIGTSLAAKMTKTISFPHDDDICYAVEGTQQAIYEMVKNEKGGVIINVASIGGILPMAQSPVYGATKAGVIHFSRCLAEFGSAHNIRVNTIWYACDVDPYLSRVALTSLNFF